MIQILINISDIATVGTFLKFQKDTLNSEWIYQCIAQYFYASAPVIAVAVSIMFPIPPSHFRKCYISRTP